MSIPTCVEFWIWFAGGVFIVPLIEWLKTLPKVGPILAQWAWLLAPMLSALVPAIASAATPLCGKIDPLLWIALYAGITYLINQLVYWIGKKTSLVK